MKKLKDWQFRLVFVALIAIIRELGFINSRLVRQTEYIIDIHQDVWNMYNEIK